MQRLITTLLIVLFQASSALAADDVFFGWGESTKDRLTSLKYRLLSDTETTQEIMRHYLRRDCNLILNRNVGSLRTVRRRNASKCSELINDFFQVLDMSVTASSEGSSLPLVFTENLNDYLENPNLKNFLEVLNYELEENEDDFDLYEIVSLFTSDKSKRIDIIATLLQDTSHSISTAEFAKNKLTQNPENKEVYDSYITLMVKFKEVTQKVNFGFIDLQEHRLYPEAVEQKMHVASFYHFYVMANATLKMKQLGYNDKEAMIMPYLMNYYYELIDYGYRYLIMPTPKQFDSKRKLTDIYLGYCGAAWALDKECIPAEMFFHFADVDFRQLHQKLFNSF